MVKVNERKKGTLQSCNAAKRKNYVELPGPSFFFFFFIEERRRGQGDKGLRP